METKPFAELTLSPKVLAAIEAAGYTNATPIQSAAIPVAVAGLDVLGIAQTGTGKTAAFTLPMITRLETGRARARMPRSLILAPTRELAAQVAQAFEKYGVNHKLDVALLIGGVSMDEQVKKLDRGVDVLIATPGRLLDHFGRGRIMLMGVEILVIDEADRMLDMGFIPDIEKICKLLPPKRQTLFFSATMPPEITRLADQFLKNPVRVEVAKPATTAKTITQRFRFSPGGEDWEKREVLRDLIKTEQVKNAIIFCNRKRDVAILLKSLLKHGFNAGALHGDMEQSARMATLDKFRSGEITLLAASDVAARGLDIPDVSHVFNFDLPWQTDDYVHRIGRTGRAGKLGTAFSIVSPDDLKHFQDIEKMLGEPAQWMGEPPTEQDFADSGKRRRGRGGRGGRPGERAHGAREHGERSHGARGGRGERREGDAPRENRPPRDRNRGGDMLRAAASDPRPQREARDEPGEQMAPREAREQHPRRETTSPPPQQSEHRRQPRRAPLADAPGFGPQPDLDAPVHDNQPRREPEPSLRREPRQDRGPRPERQGRPHGDRPERGAQDRGSQERGSQERAPREHRASGQRHGEPRHGEPRQADRRPAEPAFGAEPVRPDRVKQERPQREQPRQEKPQQRERQPQGGAVGFADNVPAFLRRPPRPAKAAND